MRIEFKEEAPYLINRMLMYCYTLSWPEDPMESGENEEQWVSPLDTIVRMYALGDKFDLQGLKKEAGERFTAYLDNPPSIFLQCVREFIAAIPLIYATTPGTDRGLRDRAVRYGSQYWDTLWGQTAFKDGLTEIGDFINDVVIGYQSQRSALDWYE